MPHPSYYYIKFLVVQNWFADPPVTHTTLSDTLTNIGLPYVSEAVFDRARFQARPPETFVFSNRKHRASIQFMKEQKIYSIWQPDEDMKRLLNELLENMRVRDRIDILLMGQVASAEIAERVNKMFNLSPGVSKQMIDAYRHYFWNPDLLSLRDWSDVLAGDPRSDALIASYLCGPEHAFYRAGLNPSPEDPQFPLREYYRQAFYVLESSRFKPDSGGWIGMRSRLASDLRVFYELLYGSKKGEQDRFSSLREFVMKKDPALFKTWEDVQGTHSGDGTKPSQVEEKEGDHEPEQ